MSVGVSQSKVPSLCTKAFVQLSSNRKKGGLAFDKIWGFPGTHLGVPIMRMAVCGGLYWGPPHVGNCHFMLGHPIKQLPARGFGFRAHRFRV